ncbi:MAG: hypothetical protein KTR20_01455 [Cellvibrionaceae bacterium]|nr:hypothetical protein [Cellvibrionaceae bacterium]
MRFLGLSEDEQIALKRLVKTGRTAAYKRRRAQILLQADENRSGGGLQDKNTATNHDNVCSWVKTNSLLG